MQKYRVTVMEMQLRLGITIPHLLFYQHLIGVVEDNSTKTTVMFPYQINLQFY